MATDGNNTRCRVLRTAAIIQRNACDKLLHTQGEKDKYICVYD